MGNSPKLNQLQRKAKLTALLASGMSQTEAAKVLNVSRSTIKLDLQDIRPSVEEVKDLQARAESYIESVMPIEKRIDNYVILAKHANNEAVRQGSTQRLDEMQGFVTQKELTRAKQSEQPANQAMFILAPGMNISFGPSTTGSGSLPDNGAIEVKPNVINTDDNA